MRTISRKGNDRTRTKALMGNYKQCTGGKRAHTHIKFVMTEDVREWYFMLGASDSKNNGEFSGDSNEFLQGQFLGKITATAVYPFGPPNVEMLTPTGVFPLNNSNFCIDIGKYHKDNYPPTLGMDGYVKMIWSGLIGWESLGYGINLLTKKGPKSQMLTVISKASGNSQKYNLKHNAKILQLFEDAAIERAVAKCNLRSKCEK
jgi:ubiquitin-protein ligase